MDKPSIIRRNIYEDLRGSFEKLYDSQMRDELSLVDFTIKQVNRSINKSKGTVRGLHYQKGSESEAKLISILHGTIRDYAVDLRVGQNTFGQVWEFNLSFRARTTLYIPRGFAHGFQTLEDDTELLYFHSNHYRADHESGINILDPTLNIQLPLAISNMSNRDQSFLSLKEEIKSGKTAL